MSYRGIDLAMRRQAHWAALTSGDAEHLEGCAGEGSCDCVDRAEDEYLERVGEDRAQAERDAAA